MNRPLEPAAPRPPRRPAPVRGVARRPEPSRRRDPLYGSPARVAALAGLSLGLGYLIGRALAGDGRAQPAAADGTRQARLARSRKLLYSASATLSFSSLADSGLQHSKGRFRDPFMYLAPTISSVTLATSTRRALRPQEGGGGAAVYATAAAAGLAGFGFHIYNVGGRPGGFDLVNLMYGAPLVAPGTLLGAGAAGLAAESVGRRLAGGRGQLSGRMIAGGAAGAMLGAVAEVALLHYRGAFQNPYMYLPVTLPPVAAAALAAAGVNPTRRTIATARTLSGATAVLGILGAAFHAYGIHRNMGGWGNWSQMIIQGPPLPAPPGFTGVALAGLGALDLLEAER